MQFTKNIKNNTKITFISSFVAEPKIPGLVFL